LPLLEAALAARPDDLPAWEAKAEALRLLGRVEEGLAAYSAALGRDPTRQTALEGAARLVALAKKPAEAISLWKRAIAVNPWRSDYFAELGLAELQVGHWREAAEVCKRALWLNPALIEPRKCLVESYLQLGRKEDARHEYQILMGFEPQERAVLEEWFAPRLLRP
jgi:tetratricopeptide (TPR) repeat protein